MENHKNSAKFIPRGNEKRIIKDIQGDIPIASRPFLEISKQTGMSESEVIVAIRKMKQEKVIRKFGAVLRHQKSGYTENAILIISAGRQAPQKIGAELACFREISHCYQREPQFIGRYGIFAMVHTRRGELNKLVKTIIGRIGVSDYLVLTSDKEFKKTSLEPI